jgi:hypothetical protein
MTGEELKFLTENNHFLPNLQRINLKRNKIVDEGLKNVAEMDNLFPKLQKIDF